MLMPKFQSLQDPQTANGNADWGAAHRTRLYCMNITRAKQALAGNPQVDEDEFNKAQSVENKKSLGPQLALLQKPQQIKAYRDADISVDGKILLPHYNSGSIKLPIGSDFDTKSQEIAENIYDLLPADKIMKLSANFILLIDKEQKENKKTAPLISFKKEKRENKFEENLLRKIRSWVAHENMNLTLEGWVARLDLDEGRRYHESIYNAQLVPRITYPMSVKEFEDMYCS